METTEALLNASPEEQGKWVLEKFPEFEAMAYVQNEWGDTCIGMFYNLYDDDLVEYLEDPEDYGTVDLIRSEMKEVSKAREEEIFSGAELTVEEKSALKRAIAEKDGENWIGLHGWDAPTADGSVFVVGYGFQEGQVGIRLKRPEIYHLRQDAIDMLMRQDVWSEV